jgi:general secretion pathway protein E
VRTSGSTAGERLQLSANEKSRWDFKLETIGLSTEQLSSIQSLSAQSPPKGTVLVATPKGQGRTSTLYALVRSHDAFTNSIFTLEYNLQTEIEGVTMTKFEPSAETTFAKALQSIVLKDPTIIMAADVPDTSTADAMTKFAQEGRVYAGLTAPDSFSAADRWLSLNTHREAAIETLQAVISERLVRMLCPTCKTPFQPDEGTLRRLNLPIGKNLQAFRANTGPILDKKGNKIVCPDCGGSGFRGLTGIFEVLVVTPEIRKAFKAKATHTQIRDLARKSKMILLVEHGIRKFATGVTAMNEVTRVVGGGQKSPSSSRAKVPQPQQ